MIFPLDGPSSEQDEAALVKEPHAGRRGPPGVGSCLRQAVSPATALNRPTVREGGGDQNRTGHTRGGTPPPLSAPRPGPAGCLSRGRPAPPAAACLPFPREMRASRPRGTEELPKCLSCISTRALNFRVCGLCNHRGVKNQPLGATGCPHWDFIY